MKRFVADTLSCKTYFLKLTLSTPSKLSICVQLASVLCCRCIARWSVVAHSSTYTLMWDIILSDTVAFMNLSHWLIHTPCPQAVLLCQLLVPVDYELAFSLLSTHSRLDRYSVSAVLLMYLPLSPSLSLFLSVWWQSLTSRISGTWLSLNTSFVSSLDCIIGQLI